MRRTPLNDVLLMLLMVLSLAGCDRGPGPDAMRQQLQDRLDTHFQQDLFSVLAFRRTGSAPFQDLEHDISGVYSYCDAELELQNDYSLTNWQGLNLGTLAYAIGATESGVEGFRAQGNVSGDVLKVHGRFAYRSNGEGGWVSLDDDAGPRPSHNAEPGSDSHGRSPESVMSDARALSVKAQEFKGSTRDALIVEELDAAIERIDLRTARSQGKITLGSGTAPGTYYSFGEALVPYAQQRGIAIFSAVPAAVSMPC